MMQRRHKRTEEKNNNSLLLTHTANKSNEDVHKFPACNQYLLCFAVYLIMHGIFYTHQFFHLKHHGSSHTVSRHISPTLSDIQLFVPCFPGGFWELKSTSFRTLQFFWPKNELDIVVVLDDTVYEDEATKEMMNNRVLSFFKHRHQMKNISIAYNPCSDNTLYGDGWHMQQLIMFWADNFTDAPYVGFFDDDTVFTRAVNVDDMFDNQGRPRVIARYPPGIMKYKHIEDWYRSQFWAFGGIRSYIFAMSYFPVVIKREHLVGVREAILNAHPEFGFFDQFFIELNKKYPKQFSQFGIMFDHIWRHHRDEYSWHFEPFGWGIGSNLGSNDYSFISPGSPEENGVVEEMRLPIPRIAMHLNYMVLNQNVHDEGIRDNIVSKVMKQGYCFSLPLVSYTLNNQSSDETCSGYDIWNDMNNKLEWAFEEDPYGLVWPKYFPNSTLEAHQQRILKNHPHQWDQEELTSLGAMPSEVL